MTAERGRDPGRRTGGLIGWLISHRVAPNLIMLALIVGGLYMSTRITQEVFPEFEQRSIHVSVAYPGATPEQIEQGVVLPVEEAVRGIDGVDVVDSTAHVGRGNVRLELIEGADLDATYREVRRAVNGIGTFPDAAEDPHVDMSGWRRDVLDILVFGKAPDHSLRAAADMVRDRLALQPGVTQVSVSGVRTHEIHIEIDEARLRAHGLTLQQVGRAVASNARDVSAGRVRTHDGEILLNVDARRTEARALRDIVVQGSASGALVRLGDIAKVDEAFSRMDGGHAEYNGQRAVGIRVFRVGSETPLGVSDAVRAALPEIRADLPSTLDVAVHQDRSKVYRQRLELLLTNGAIGLLLVLLVLSLFLELKLAFWVTAGIPTAFLGAFLLLPGMGVSINMISLFAFIVALGIVVDDAIVAGENIYEYRSRDMGLLRAAIQGARDIAGPIVFSVLTNVVAFLPLALIPGHFGQIWAVIPAVVAAVFAISLIEALVILPTHLAYAHELPHSGPGPLTRLQGCISGGLNFFARQVYGRALALAMRWRYVTLAGAVAVLGLVLAYPMSGKMGFVLMPRIASDTAAVTAAVPPGTPLEELEAVRTQLTEAAQRAIAATGGEAVSEGLFSTATGNQTRVTAYLTPVDERPISNEAFVRRWRAEVGTIEGLEWLRFDGDHGGPGGGPSVSIGLSHPDVRTLQRASEVLAARLDELEHVSDVDDGFSQGKPQWNIRVTEAGSALGLNAAIIGNQLRAGMFGAEAFTLLRGGNEVTVRVQLPEAQRNGPTDVSSFMIRTPAGRHVPLNQVATIERGEALTWIHRRNGRRMGLVTANVNPPGQINRIITTVREELLPQLSRDFPQLAHSFQGQQKTMRDAIDSFYVSCSLAALAIFALLALPFRSYVQPLIVMASIPFGIVGAVLGHLIMGYGMSLISVMGIIALGGVVVNGALVMIDYANGRRREGASLWEAVHGAGVRRFRPIFLTTVTTFGGLAPMIFETSVQAQLMIPMAISLGFGILFSSSMLMFVVPCLYLVVEDVRGLLAGRAGPAAQPASAMAQ